MWLTSKELAERWRLTEQVLRRWRHKKQGPPFTKLGDNDKSPVRYALADIEKWETKNKN